MSVLLTLAAEGPNGKFIPADIKELWFGGAAFLIVLGLMVWKLFPVISKALGDRGDRIAAELAAAEKAPGRGRCRDRGSQGPAGQRRRGRSPRSSPTPRPRPSG